EEVIAASEKIDAIPVAGDFTNLRPVPLEPRFVALAPTRALRCLDDAAYDLFTVHRQSRQHFERRICAEIAGVDVSDDECALSIRIACHDFPLSIECFAHHDALRGAVATTISARNERARYSNPKVL